MGYDIRRMPELEIPSVPLVDVLGEAKANISFSIQKHEDGSLHPDQAMALLALAVAAAPKVVLEIGTFMGHTTKLLAMNLPEATIHTVDLPLDYVPEQDHVTEKQKDDFHLISQRRVGREYRGTRFEARVRQHFADTASWDFKKAAGATFFFIDGSHTYDYAKNDSERCYELCGGKGVFVWHDCDEAHPGVVKALLEWRALGRDVVCIRGTPIAYWKNI
jgi:methyltransferase family protein